MLHGLRELEVPAVVISDFWNVSSPAPFLSIFNSLFLFHIYLLSCFLPPSFILPQAKIYANTPFLSNRLVQ
ncbi:hypothetical protein BDQ12DRAFT_692932 [Crucibulum laeve]|uniref:Uncharacterized protein n=1 Tax=Crucibulum laeve TaxID=68775 RepID=A0A5C3LJN1_9AGAR|nr:hypothetical protein BDQ12DRAFT_692932 [Crucibulum laeve]